jgi:hypothetical protein
VGGVIKGCSLGTSTLTLKFNVPGGRKLQVKAYNKTNPGLSATSVLVNQSNNGDDSAVWTPVHISLGTNPGTVTVELPKLSGASAGAVTAVRYAWGAPDGAPNDQDVSCCEGDGDTTPCVPVQCPLLADEPLAPFGALPIDPFIAEIKAGKCECPEPQQCSE